MVLLVALAALARNMDAVRVVVQGWESKPEARAVVVSLFRRIIGWFGSKRCMFASNFPGELLV